MLSTSKGVRPKPPKQESDRPRLSKEEIINQKVNQARESRDLARQEGRNQGKEFFDQDIQGLDPQKRKAMQYEANKGIQREVQSANRKLLGEQSRHGVVGRGGVGYAQQRDLHRLGTEAKGQAHRDLDKLDSDLAMKKLASIFAVGEGEAAQRSLDRQLALDELEIGKERKYQRKRERKYDRQFSRV